MKNKEYLKKYLIQIMFIIIVFLVIFLFVNQTQDRENKKNFNYKNKELYTTVRGSDGFRTQNTPGLFEVFPTAEIGQLPTELSCAEQAISSPQNIHVNMTAANLMFGYVNKILNYRPINELAIFFDTTTQQTSVYRATKSGLEDLMRMTPNNASILDYLPDSALSNESEADLVHPPKLSELPKVELKEVEAL